MNRFKKKEKHIGNKKIPIIILISVLTSALIAGGAVFLFNSKNSQVSSTYYEEETEPETISFENQSFTLTVGENFSPDVNYESEQKENIKWRSENCFVAQVDNLGDIKAVAPGNTTVTAVLESGVSTECDIKVVPPENYLISDVPLLTQGTYYPSGCESVSSAMLMKYFGFDISVDDFINDYLPQSYLMADENGYYGPDTSSYYLGSPYSEDSLGCYPPVIVYAMNKYFSENEYADCTAIDTSGLTMDELCGKYVANDIPVLVWSTMYLNEPYISYEWRVSETTDYSDYKVGDTCKWLAWEHCLVLIGYDEENYYFNDPLFFYETSYPKEAFNLRFNQIGDASLTIIDNR